MPAHTSADQEQAQVQANNELWEEGDYVADYAHRNLRPVEIILLVRYRDALRGRVLELGCGAGRVTGYLATISDQTHGIDISPAMVAFCQRTYPSVTFRQGDLRDMSAYDNDSFDVIFGPNNVLDVLTDDERQRAFDELRRLIAPDGLLIFSTHNRDHAPRITKPLEAVRWRNPGLLLRDLPKLRRRVRNRRRLLAHERVEDRYAILNDISHDYLALHYYISRDEQQRQLHDHGFELIECLDLEGRRVESGALLPDCPELHYVARLAA